uniref:Uncharacterized protein n=1 Tax=Anguilla anguilla TaxID=7936 RepID=A0A0E9Q6Z8_ANGAN
MHGHTSTETRSKMVAHS